MGEGIGVSFGKGICCDGDAREGMRKGAVNIECVCRRFRTGFVGQLVLRGSKRASVCGKNVFKWKFSGKCV